MKNLGLFSVFRSIREDSFGITSPLKIGIKNTFTSRKTSITSQKFVVMWRLLFVMEEGVKEKMFIKITFTTFT